MTVEELLRAIAQHTGRRSPAQQLGAWLHWLDRRGLATRTPDRRWRLTDRGRRSFAS